MEIPDDLKNELYGAYTEFMKMALKKMSLSIRLSRKIRKSYQKQRLRFGIAAQVFGSVKQDIQIYDSTKYLVEAFRQQFESCPQYKTIVKLMDKNDIIRSHLGDSIVLFSVIHRFENWSYISHILGELLFQKILRNRFDKFLFDKLFSDLIKFFESKEISFSMVSPLHNFDFTSKKQSLRLSRIFAIRRITRNERIRLGDKFTSSELEWDSFDRVKYVIEYRFRIIKNLNLSRRINDGLPKNIDGTFSSLVTALRLFKYGNFGIYDRYTICNLDVPIRLPGVKLYAIALGASEGLSYALSSNEISKFKEFWEFYGELLINKILDYKRYPNDKFVNIKNSFIL